MISLETKQTVIAHNLTCHLDVVDAGYKLMEGNISTPFEYWYNSMNAVGQAAFAGMAQLFADAVCLRVEAMTGERWSDSQRELAQD